MGKFTLKVQQGATYRLKATWRSPLIDLNTGLPVTDVTTGEVMSGQPIDLTGYTGRMHIRKNLTSATTYLELTTENGGIVIDALPVHFNDYVQVATTGPQTDSGLPVIDGYQTVEGDRVLRKDEVTPNTRGLWVAHVGAWTRPADHIPVNYSDGGAVWVRHGTVNGNTVWYQSETVAVITDAQEWEEATGIGSFEIIATDEQTQEIPTSGVYDVELISPAGEVARPLEGKMRLSAEVTREDD